MNKIEVNCDICRDLMPLVSDEVASEASAEAVKKHIKYCDECRAIFGNKNIPEIKKPNTSKMLTKMRNRINSFYAVVMMLGIYWGISVTGSMELFFNCLIMPIVGILGYILFRKKSFVYIPLLLLVANILLWLTGLTASDESLAALLPWIFVYTLFAYSGIVIALLLRFAFGKEKSHEK